jgi:hypothetical protein
VRVRVRPDARQITDAINSFSHTYHDEFSEVRAIGRKYLAEATPTDSVVADLARALRDVLGSWGAGKRKAPRLQSAGEFTNVLRQSETHASLAALGRIPLSSLTVVQRHRYLGRKPAAPEELAGFDSNLLSALRTLGERLFIGNTNATYPMKVMLLITGLMPAFDSQVRTGLQRGGFLGWRRLDIYSRLTPKARMGRR